MEQSQSRRSFLKLLTHLCGGILITPTVQFSAYSQDSPSRFENLSVPEAEKLFLMTRVLFPHDKLGDDPYWAVVKQFDTMCGDAAFNGLITSGIAEMDKAAGLKWVNVSETKKVQILQSIESGTFFQTVRIITLLKLYGSAHVAKSFGHEGSSFEHGGYLYRGFNDLTWLPEPPS